MQDGIRRGVLRGRMAENHHNIATMARAIKVSRSTLSAFFNGAAPSYGLIRKIQKELALSPQEIGMIFFGDL